MKIDYVFTTLGLSFIMILSYTSGVGISVAQLQNETTNQIQMQSGWWYMSFPKYDPIKNGLGFGLQT